jgi:hypothetical protein
MSKVLALLVSAGFISIALASEPTQQEPTVPSVPSNEAQWSDPSKKRDSKWDHRVAEHAKSSQKEPEGIKWANLNTWDKKKEGKVSLTAPTFDAPDGEMSK